jgi:hypothetical protein
MANLNFALALITALLLQACGTTDHRSIPERASNFTRHVLAQDPCPNGTIEGSEKLGASTDSYYRYSARSTDRGGQVRYEELGFNQTGFKDVKCAPKSKEVKTSPTAPKPEAKK